MCLGYRVGLEKCTSHEGESAAENPTMLLVARPFISFRCASGRRWLGCLARRRLALLTRRCRQGRCSRHGLVRRHRRGHHGRIRVRRRLVGRRRARGRRSHRQRRGGRRCGHR